MRKIDTITLLKYQEGSLDQEQSAEIDAYLAEHPEALEMIMDLDRIEQSMDQGHPLPLPGTASIIVQVAQGVMERFSCEGAQAEWIPLAAARSDKNELPAAQDKKLAIQLQDLDIKLELLSLNDDSYRITIQGASLSGHLIKLKRKGDDFPLYTKKAGSSPLTIKGLAQGEYEIIFLNECVDILITEKQI